MRLLAIGLFAAAVAALACKGKDAPGATSTGPVYTPANANAVRALAPHCELAKGATTGIAQVVTCDGQGNSVRLELVDGERVKRVAVKLRAMAKFQAKRQLGFGLAPLAGPQLTAQLNALIDKLDLGQRDSVQVGTAQLGVVAGGTAKHMPAYEIDIVW